MKNTINYRLTNSRGSMEIDRDYFYHIIKLTRDGIPDGLSGRFKYQPLIDIDDFDKDQKVQLQYIYRPKIVSAKDADAIVNMLTQYSSLLIIYLAEIDDFENLIHFQSGTGFNNIILGEIERLQTFFQEGQFIIDIENILPGALSTDIDSWNR